MIPRRKISIPAWNALLALCIVNFLSFVVIDLRLGGNALSGKAAGGAHFLGDHGSFTEVSAAVYWYSFWHSVLTILLFVVTFVAAISVAMYPKHPRSSGVDDGILRQLGARTARDSPPRSLVYPARKRSGAWTSLSGSNIKEVTT